MAACRSVSSSAAKQKPLRLVLLLDASGSMSMYTGVFLRFIHGVLDSFREAEAFLFHTHLSHVSDAMKEKIRARAGSPLDHGAGAAAPRSAKAADLQCWHAARVTIRAAA
jgi:uncharacterized protein with von Willebrand factor type A (vWA) domain